MQVLSGGILPNLIPPFNMGLTNLDLYVFKRFTFLHVQYKSAPKTCQGKAYPNEVMMGSEIWF